MSLFIADYRRLSQNLATKHSRGCANLVGDRMQETKMSHVPSKGFLDRRRGPCCAPLDLPFRLLV
jgi:hypothetical protein